MTDYYLWDRDKILEAADKTKLINEQQKTILENQAKLLEQFNALAKMVADIHGKVFPQPIPKKNRNP